MAGQLTQERALCGVDRAAPSPYVPRRAREASFPRCAVEDSVMKIKNSLRAAKSREKNCIVIRRKGRVYVINKRHPRFKVRQG